MGVCHIPALEEHGGVDHRCSCRGVTSSVYGSPIGHRKRGFVAEGVAVLGDGGQVAYRDPEWMLHER